MANKTKSFIIRKFIAKNKVECPICFESSDAELKLFPCQHYACQECIGKLEKYKTNKVEGFDCPECRQYVAMPPGGLPTYRVGMTLNDELDQLYVDMQKTKADPTLTEPQKSSAAADTDCQDTNTTRLTSSTNPLSSIKEGLPKDGDVSTSNPSEGVQMRGKRTIRKKHGSASRSCISEHDTASLVRSSELEKSDDALTPFERFEWFKKVGREEAEDMLIKQSQGTFLVRQVFSNETTTDKGYHYTLSVKHDGEKSSVVRHYPIREWSDEGMWYIYSGSDFNSMEQLIEHYKNEMGDLCCKLSSPIASKSAYKTSVSASTKTVDPQHSSLQERLYNIAS